MVKSQCGFGRINGGHIGVQVGQDIPPSAMRPEHTHLQMLLPQQATVVQKKAFVTISFAHSSKFFAAPRIAAIAEKRQL